MRAIWLSLLGWLWLLGGAAMADQPRSAWDDVAPPVFRHLTIAEGLPYPVGLAVAQDGKGFVWAATPGGLARWDGYRMTVFRHDDADPASLPENIVTRLAVDEHGQLWLGTVSGIIARYDETIRGFAVYRDQGGGFGRILGMAADRRGGIWVASGQGLAHLDIAGKTWSHEGGALDSDVAGILVDRAGRVWAGSAKGLMVRPGGQDGFRSVVLPPEMAGDMVSAMFEDSAGTLWFGTRRGQIGRVDAQGRAASMEPAAPATGHRVTSFSEPRPGRLWIGEYGGGIRELRVGAGAARTFRHDPRVKFSLGDNSVTEMIRDRSGIIWVSSLRGLHYHIPGNGRVTSIVPSQPDGLPGPDIRSVAAASGGRIWLGFRAAGLALLDPARNVVRTIPPRPGPGGLPEEVVQTVAETSRDVVWAGQTGGLFRVDAAKGVATPYAPLKGANILVLRHEGQTLWAGGSMGLARIGLDGGPQRLYRFERDNPASLSDNSAQALFRDHARRLWVGTYRGLNLLEDPEQGRFRRILHDPDDLQSLPSDIVIGITEDRSGRLWLATANGIGIFDPNLDGKPKFRRLNTAGGLPSDTVLSVIGGEDGKIIAGTGKGLCVIDPDTLAVRVLGPAEGSYISTFWAGAAIRMADNTLALGGFGGMTLVSPGDLPPWSFQPPVVVTEIRGSGQSFLPGKPVVITPDDNSLQVDFAALDFSAPEMNRYAYRLSGNDKDWVAATSLHRTAGYTNLPPGTHTLQIRGSNSAGTWSEVSPSLKIRVLPAWHQTAWFRLLAVLALIAALVGLIRWRQAHHVRREQELTRQVLAKTAETEAAMRRALAGEEDARKAKEEAQAADRMKSRFLAIIGHEIRTPLNGLLGMLQLLDLGAEPKNRADLVAVARDAGNNLRDLVDSVLEYGRDGAKSPEPVLGIFDLRRLVTDTVGLFRPQIEAGNLDLTVRISPDGPQWIRSDRNKLYRIVLNLMGNAAKFTERGGIAVEASLTPQDEALRLIITVSDDGVGIAPEMQEAIFGDFVQADDSITRKFGGAGLGLAISRRLATQIGGSLSVKSQLGAGSTFRLDAMVEKAPPPQSSESRPVAGPSLRVLVVDDDAVSRRVAERLLAHMGHRPSVAAGGQEALVILAQEGFDVILTDLRMPGMDGMDLSRRIREGETAGRSRTRILAMTADLGDDILAHCLEAGMDGGMAKPIRLDVMNQTLAGALHPPRPWEGRLDRNHLATQLEILGPQEMVRLARLFQRTSRDMLASLDRAAAEADRATIAALAHRLRSAAGPLGMTELGAGAARLEVQAAVQAVSDLKASIAELRSARRTALAELPRTARDLLWVDGLLRVDGDGKAVADAADRGDHGRAAIQPA